MMMLRCLLLIASCQSFSIVTTRPQWTTTTALHASTTTSSFIDDALRGAAMKLHTRQQAPKEGQVQAPERKPYTPTSDDYLAFLVDSQHVYQTMEDIVNQTPELAQFRNTGLERTEALEHDIQYMIKTYQLERPDVGEPGRTYAETLRKLSTCIPAFVCHYYNHYFAHTAGGRMIGKKMSSLLLDGTTLEFYKWEHGNLNDMKQAVKDTIEAMAAEWTEEEQNECIQETAAAFANGGALNSYLSQGRR